MAESLRQAARSAAGASVLPRPSAALRSLLSARFAPTTLFLLALGAGALVRIMVVANGDGFPLNDGGMFLVMVEDIRGNGYLLPEVTSYNGAGIPFAYPPLPFYLAAALSDAFRWPVTDLLIVIPLLFSILTIPAFWLLARSMLEKPLYAGIATLLFVSIPRSFNWEVVGGGLTRSPGLFFATLALWQVHELFKSGRRVHLAPAIVLSALTVLCHMEMGWFVAFSTLLFAIWYRQDRRVHVNAPLLAAGVAVLTAPWYLTVLMQSGLEPLLSAVRAGGHSPVLLLAPLMLHFTEDELFPFALALGLLGLLACVRDRRYLLPVWMLVIFVVDPRKAFTLSALPLALLAAVGLIEVIWPLVRREADGGVPSWALAAATFVLVIYGPIAALVSANDNSSPLSALPAGQRQAMTWASSQTDEDARFAVVPSSRTWATDAPAEWFPALADRVSVNTVQGSEWLGSTYDERQQAYEALVECASGDIACLDDWVAAGRDREFSHVYVPKGDSPAGVTFLSRQRLDCCRSLLESLRGASGYTLVFENDDAVIFERASR